MELCKEGHVEEYVIQVVEAPDLYNHLRFSLLASTWIPRPLGACLWSLLHVILAIYVPLMFLALFTSLLVLAVGFDVFICVVLLYMLLLFPFVILGCFVGIVVGVALIWIWLVISCHCCTMPGRAPGQGVGQYILTGGRTPNRDPEPQPVAVERRGAAAGPELWEYFTQYRQTGATPLFVNHVKSVSFPYWSSNLKNFCREIVPLYETIVI